MPSKPHSADQSPSGRVQVVSATRLGHVGGVESHDAGAELVEVCSNSGGVEVAVVGDDADHGELLRWSDERWWGRRDHVGRAGRRPSDLLGTITR